MSEIEEKARKGGWVPREEFRGDPDKWKDAETFVQIGDTLMPVMRERLAKMEAKLDEQKGEFSEKLDKANASLKKLADHHRGTRKRAVEQAKRDLKAEMREAAKTGDLERYDLLSQEEAKIVEPTTPTTTPEFQTWVKDNTWYNEDPVLANYADQLGPHLAADSADDAEFYARIRKGVQAAFPTHSAFQEGGDKKEDTPPRQPVPSVEGGGIAPSGEGVATGKTWEDLPQEVKATYDLEFSDMKEYFTREDYAKDYFAQFEESE